MCVGTVRGPLASGPLDQPLSTIVPLGKILDTCLNTAHRRCSNLLVSVLHQLQVDVPHTELNRGDRG